MLFKSGKKNIAKSIPDGQLVYAIGDIHGAYDKLVGLLENIKHDAGSHDLAVTIVFLGDLIDRGPDSAKVVEFLSGYNPDYAETIFLMGNHEETFLKVLRGSKTSLQAWFNYGGRACARSYGVENLGRVLSSPGQVVMDIQHAVPDHHLEFLSTFKNYHIVGNYLFVHAGIKPKVALEKQSPTDMRWIRKKFLDYKKPHPYQIVHGHTVVDSPEVLSNRIAVDTGAHRAGFPLTAVKLKASNVSFIQSIS